MSELWWDLCACWEQLSLALLIHALLAATFLRAWRAPSRRSALQLMGAGAVGTVASLVGAGIAYVSILRRLLLSACVADGSSSAAFAMVLRVVDEDLARVLIRGGFSALLPATIGLVVFVAELRPPGRA